MLKHPVKVLDRDGVCVELGQRGRGQHWMLTWCGGDRRRGRPSGLGHGSWVTAARPKGSRAECA